MIQFSSIQCTLILKLKCVSNLLYFILLNKQKIEYERVNWRTYLEKSVLRCNASVVNTSLYKLLLLLIKIMMLLLYWRMKNVCFCSSLVSNVDTKNIVWKKIVLCGVLNVVFHSISVWNAACMCVNYMKKKKKLINLILSLTPFLLCLLGKRNYILRKFIQEKKTKNRGKCMLCMYVSLCDIWYSYKFF